MIKKDYKGIDIYYISYVTVKEIASFKNINTVNALYLMINEMIGQIFSFEWCGWK